MSPDRRVSLQFTTWLSPGLPVGLFETIATVVGEALGSTYDLSVEEGSSGPMDPDHDRFAAGTTDIGFVCATSYLWLAGNGRRSVDLVPVAPVYDDPRASGRPVYFSDLVVAAAGPIESFADLRGRRVGYNDESSLSGYVSMLARLADDGHRTDRFAEFQAMGSHRAALTGIAAGEIDAAAIDANALRAWYRERPGRERLVRSIETIGPHPVQPIVVRSTAEPGLVDAIADVLREPSTTEALAPFGIEAFAPVHHDDYLAVNDRITLASTATT